MIHGLRERLDLTFSLDFPKRIFITSNPDILVKHGNTAGIKDFSSAEKAVYGSHLHKEMVHYEVETRVKVFASAGILAFSKLSLA